MPSAGKAVPIAVRSRSSAPRSASVSGAVIGLVLDGERRAEVREREAAGILGEVARERELVGVRVCRHGRPA